MLSFDLSDMNGNTIRDLLKQAGKESEAGNMLLLIAHHRMPSPKSNSRELSHIWMTAVSRNYCIKSAALQSRGAEELHADVWRLLNELHGHPANPSLTMNDLRIALASGAVATGMISPDGVKARNFNVFMLDYNSCGGRLFLRQLSIHEDKLLDKTRDQLIRNVLHTSGLSTATGKTIH